MDQEFPGPDPARSRMRATMAIIDGQIATLAKPESELAIAWADLVKQLSLGPEPELRTCPHCKVVGMRGAKVCSGCWAKLTPLDEHA